MDKNIREIQELYIEKEKKLRKKEKEKGVQDEEIFLYKPYEISTWPKTLESTFMQDKINNLEKHMKFIYSPVKTRVFNLPLHYKSIWSKGEQDKLFWNKVVVAFLEQKHNIDISRNRFPISIYQEELSYKPYFIALSLQGQPIIGPNKKVVTSHMVGDLLLLD